MLFWTVLALLAVGGSAVPKKIDCGENAKYVKRGTACPLTCENYKNPPVCKKPDVAGCQCDEGYVLNKEEECVKKEDCKKCKKCDSCEDGCCGEDCDCCKEGCCGEDCDCCKEGCCGEDCKSCEGGCCGEDCKSCEGGCCGDDCKSCKGDYKSRGKESKRRDNREWRRNSS